MDRFQSISKYKVEYLEYCSTYYLLKHHHQQQKNSDIGDASVIRLQYPPCSQYLSVGLRNLVPEDGEDGPASLTPLVPATCGIQLLLLWLVAEELSQNQPNHTFDRNS
jgi:hypothetical protein